MKQLLNGEELVGKTIKTVQEIGNRFFVFLEDETYCVLYAPDTVDVEVILMQEVYSPPYTGPIAEKLIEHGVLSLEGYKKSSSVLARLKEVIKKEQILDMERKKEKDEYLAKNQDKITTCCSSRNHFLFQGYPYCHECNSVCELESL